MSALPLVFLHGWGQAPRIWQHQVDHFSKLCPVHTPALPGHGGAADAPAGQWVDILAEALPETPAVLVGWSLGGMLALALARNHPGRVAGLALVATTPCFRDREDWAHGCDAATFQAFAQGVAGSSAKFLGRFFALMLQGDGLGRRDYNALTHTAVDRAHPPTQAGLAAGLDLLERLDLREDLATIGQPAWVAHGDNDAIIPAAAGRHLAESLPHASWYGFEACGHAPFLTQPESFNAQLEAWCRNISSPNG
jgi:pimeloyl-[acyl-carrier protein] methyl ester esterase